MIEERKTHQILQNILSILYIAIFLLHIVFLIGSVLSCRIIKRTLNIQDISTNTIIETIKNILF